MVSRRAKTLLVGSIPASKGNLGLSPKILTGFCHPSVGVAREFEKLSVRVRLSGLAFKNTLWEKQNKNFANCERLRSKNDLKRRTTANSSVSDVVKSSLEEISRCMIHTTKSSSTRKLLVNYARVVLMRH